MSAAELDLARLSRERADPPRLRPPRRRLRLLLPFLLLAALALLFGENLRDALRGVREVRFVRPAPVAAGAARAAAGEVLAQAAGWVEPDPFPLRVAALAPGVVAELLVQESDAVRAGDPVARLVDDEARLAMAQAEAMVETAVGEERAAAAELEAAQAAFEAALEVTAARAEIGLREAARAQALARIALAEDELLVQGELAAAGAAGPRQVEIARSRVEEARGELAALEAEVALARARVDAAAAELARAERDFELRIEERRRVAAARADLETARGRVGEVQASCDLARLALERTLVRAPADGVVLERLALPGSSVGGEAAVATLFDPRSLRVRVDVPQQDLARLAVGQDVLVESDARPGRPYAGTVLRIVQRADIQKVTLQAHVRVLEPDGLLRPEMLVQARFLAAAAEATAAAEAGLSTAVSIPARLVDAEGRVWVLEPRGGTAARRAVELGARDGESVVVRAGLDLSDKLLDAEGEPLREGQRVRERAR